MKYLITIFFAFTTLAANAQISELTDSDKQEALQKVTQFCDLFSRWCNGERTLDTQIYNLCSGADCSAYDEVVSQEETSMRKYMNGIQKKYPQKLDCQITSPSLNKSDIVYHPLISPINLFETTNFGAVQQTFYKLNAYTNAYVVFDVTLSMSSINRNLVKKIVYDYNAKCITGFITGQGTMISFLNGIKCMTDGKYREAIQLFDIASSNNRSSLKNVSSVAAMACCEYIKDIPLMRKYANASGDELLINFMEVREQLTNNNIDEDMLKKMAILLPSLKKCEEIAVKNDKYTGYLPSLYAMLGSIYSLPSLYSPYYNLKLSVEYYKKSIALGYVPAAHSLIKLCTITDDDDIEKYVTDDEFDKYLFGAVEKGHPVCMAFLGKQYETKGSFTEAKDLYKRGAKLGYAVFMAKLGRLLVNKGSKEEGIHWLRKSVEGNALQQELNMFQDEIEYEEFWPTSVDDVKKLLNGTVSPSSSAASSTYQSSTPSPSYSNTTSSSNSNSSATSSSSYTSSYSSHSHYKPYHGPFNKKQDSYWGGLSFGYIQKQWVYEEDGDKDKYGMFDDAKYMNGIQAGIRVDPQFGAGFGMNSGLFYEYCWDKSDDYHDEYGTYHYTYEEHGIYMPVHLKFTMNFSKWFQLSLYGGIGMNYVFAGNLYLRDDGETYGSEDVFSEEDDFSRFNLMLEYGASIRIRGIQFDFNLSRGLTNWSDTSGIKITQNRPLNLSMTFCF